MNNINDQNLVILSFKIRMKYKFELSINQINIMKKNTKYQQ